jgi:hypothetical protein
MILHLTRSDGYKKHSASGDVTGHQRPLHQRGYRGRTGDLVAQVSVLTHYPGPFLFHLLQATSKHGRLTGQCQIKGRQERQPKHQC